MSNSQKFNFVLCVYLYLSRLNDEKEARAYLQALARSVTDSIETLKQSVVSFF